MNRLLLLALAICMVGALSGAAAAQQLQKFYTLPKTSPPTMQQQAPVQVIRPTARRMNVYAAFERHVQTLDKRQKVALIKRYERERDLAYGAGETQKANYYSRLIGILYREKDK